MGTRYSKPETLLTACSQGNYDIVKKVLEKGKVSCNIKDSNGRSPLHLVCECTKVSQAQILKIVQQLIYSDDYVNMQDNEGNTAMHYCGRNGYRNVVRTLALSGGHKSVFIQNKEGFTPAGMVERGNITDYDQQCEMNQVFLQLQYAPNMDEDDD